MTELERSVLPIIASLNGLAMEKSLVYELHACTDITGFGLLGHLLELAVGSGVHAVIDYAALPFYPGALEMYRIGQTTGSNKANRALVACHPLTVACALQAAQEEMLYDPQTSGGLLLSLPRDQAQQLVKELHAAGIAATVKIGEVVFGTAGITLQ